MPPTTKTKLLEEVSTLRRRVAELERQQRDKPHVTSSIFDNAAEELSELSQFKAVLDQTLDCVFMFDPETLRFFYVNRGAMEQVGYSEDELLQMTPLDIKPELAPASFRAMLEPLIDGSLEMQRFETVHRHKDGHDVPVEVAL